MLTHRARIEAVMPCVLHQALSAASSALFSSCTSGIDSASFLSCVWPSKYHPCRWSALPHSFDHAVTKWLHTAPVPVATPARLLELLLDRYFSSKPFSLPVGSRFQILASVIRLSCVNCCTDTSFCDRLIAKGNCSYGPLPRPDDCSTPDLCAA